MPDFTLNDAVTLRSGERGTIVALPADVAAAGGPPGCYRVKLDNTARGWEYVLPQKLTRVEQEAYDPYLYSLEAALEAIVNLDLHWDLPELMPDHDPLSCDRHILQLSLDAIRRHVEAPARDSEQETTP